jgi:hypothetical protein
MYRLPEDGRVPSKRVEVNKRLYYWICYTCICWFYKGETDFGVPKIPVKFTKFLCMDRNSDSDGPWTARKITDTAFLRKKQKLPTDYGFLDLHIWDLVIIYGRQCKKIDFIWKFHIFCKELKYIILDKKLVIIRHNKGSAVCSEYFQNTQGMLRSYSSELHGSFKSTWIQRENGLKTSSACWHSMP